MGKKDFIDIVFYSYSFKTGGAGLAANKFYNLIVNEKLYKLSLISQDINSRFHILKRLISFILSKLQFDGNSIKHSLNLFSFSSVLDSFFHNDKSIHHIHWINNDTLSIFDFDKIPIGSIITLHDEWIYCGSEHYYNVFDFSNDFISGYSLFKKGVYGFSWNYFIWKVKFNKLINRKDLIYTVPSTWMLERARNSAILNKSDIRLLPNPIDTDVFKSISDDEIELFRSDFNIDKDKIVFVFGAIRGKSNVLKGFWYLEQAFKMLKELINEDIISNIVLVDFGGKKGNGYISGFLNISVGHIIDPNYLVKLYSSADCVILPSLVESFGQVAAEALSCRTPVVCFDTSGLKDIVLHQKTGFIAIPFSVESLCQQLLKIVKMSKEERSIIGLQGRYHIKKNFSFPVVRRKYLQVIKDSINRKKNIL